MGSEMCIRDRSNKALRASLLLAMLLAFNRRQRKLLDEAVLVDDEVGDSPVGGDKLIGGSAWLLCASGAKGDEYRLWSAKGRLARTHTGQNQSDSQSALSFSYSFLLTREQQAWDHKLQASQHKPRWFFLTGFLQMVQGNLTGPGFSSTSPSSNSNP